MTVQDDINARGVERRNPRASAIGLMETTRLPRFHILTAVSLAVAFYSSLRHLYAIHRKTPPGATNKSPQVWRTDLASARTSATPLLLAPKEDPRSSPASLFLSSSSMVTEEEESAAHPKRVSTREPENVALASAARSRQDDELHRGIKASCAEEREAHMLAWSQTRRDHYFVLQPPVPAGGSRDTPLPPIWPQNSVAAGPDFECSSLLETLRRQRSSPQRLPRPSWRACTLPCAPNDAHCEVARRACGGLDECRGVARGSGRFGGLVFLKGDYVWTVADPTSTKDRRSEQNFTEGAHGVELPLKVAQDCLTLHRRVRSGRGGKVESSESARATWLHLGCGDFARPHWEQQRGHGEQAEEGTGSRGEWGGLQGTTRVASTPCRACPIAIDDGSRASSSGESSMHPDGRLAPSAVPVHIVVVTDRPSSSLCLFLKSALWANVGVTVLGWAPSRTPRWQEWYLGSKPILVADYLGRCLHRDASHLKPDSSVVIVSDADVLVNVASPRELRRALEPFYTRILQDGRVVFSSEGPCVTVNKHYRQQLCRSFEKRATNRSSSLSTKSNARAADGGYLTSLNSGLLVGTPRSLRALVRRFLRASTAYLEVVRSPIAYAAMQQKLRAAMIAADTATIQAARVKQGKNQSHTTGNQRTFAEKKKSNDDDDDGGDDISAVAALRTKYRRAIASSTAVPGVPFLVNDQSVYYLMMSVEDEEAHGISLDVSSRLFLSMYGTPNRLHLTIDRKRHALVVTGPKLSPSKGGGLRWQRTPAFVHYNGGSKLASWNPDIGRRALFAERQRDFHGRRYEESAAMVSRIDATVRREKAKAIREERGDPEEEVELDRRFRKQVLVVDDHYRRVRGLSLADMCA